MQKADYTFWKKCNSCKKPIAFGAKYYTCSVSTCNGLRTGYVFCSVPCFEVHLPGARHKDAAAMEQKAPMTAGSSASTSTAATSSEPKRTIIGSPGTGVAAHRAHLPRETLVIASRLKDYIQAKADMNSSASVMDILSDYLRVLSDRAIENARADGRKTVLDRDFEFLKK